MADSLTYTIFVPDKDKMSVQKITLDDHDGWFGLSVPRIDVSKCELDEISYPGVYFLLCGEGESIVSIYVGESGDVQNRLKIHMQSYNRGEEKFYWHTALVFGSEKLDTAKTKYLEWQWFEIFKKLGAYKVETGKVQKDTLKTKHEQKSMDKFVSFIKLVLPKLKPELLFEIKKNSQISEERLLFCKSSQSDAVGFLSEGGLTVIKGSKISDKPTDSFLNRGKGYVDLRNKLIVNGIIENNHFTEDYEFSSPSAASSIVLGRMSSGNADWYNSDNIPLKDIND